MKLLSCFKKHSNEEKFWQWFRKNSSKIFNFEQDMKAVFDEIKHHLHTINPDITFELGYIKDGKRDFIISADGIVSAFPSVETLYAKKPDLPEWNFIKFRPRRKIEHTISIAGKELSPSDVRFMLIHDENPDKIGIVLFCNGYNEKEKDLYDQIAFLYLDESLGEFDVETFVGAIIIQGFESEYFKDSRGIEELATEFDRLKCSMST